MTDSRDHPTADARAVRVAARTRLALVALLLGPLLSESAHALAIPCTEQALHERIAELNANCSGDKTIRFDCPAGSVIPLSAAIGDRSKDQDCAVQGSSWSLGVVGCSSCPPADAPGAEDPCTNPPYSFISTRTITCDGVTIDGENKVTFELVPGCHVHHPQGCTEVESHDFLFRADAADVTFKNFTYRYFWEGLQAWYHSRGVTLDHVVGIRGCDDLFTNVDATSGGHLVQNSTFRDGCDKCMQANGREVSTTTFPDYDIRFLNNVFENCETPIGFSEGRHLVVGNEFRDTGTTYQCHGPNLGHVTKPNQDPVVYFGGNTVFNCKQGIRVNGSSKFVSLGGNRFQSNGSRAVAVVDKAKALFEGDLFLNNGGVPTGWGFLGGLVVGGLAEVDAGGGTIWIDGQIRSSAGLNSFVGNRCPSDASCDLVNETWMQVEAENNWWGEDANPSDKVIGAVDYVPWLGSPPGLTCVDLDQDGYGTNCPGGPDCDDLDPSVHPGAEEIVDSKDNNCDGQVDEVNRAPRVLYYWATPTLGPAPLPVAFFCGAIDPDGDAWTATIEYGNGVAVPICQLTTNVYADPGLYVATLTLVDSFGATAKKKIQIKVTEPAIGPRSE